MDGTSKDGRPGNRTASAGAVAGDAAVARVTMLEDLVEQYRVLLDTSAVISAETDIDQALAKITRLTTECMNVAWCDIYEVRPGNDQFVVAAFYQLPELDLDASNWVGTVYDADTFADMQVAATELRPVTLYRDDPALSVAGAAELDVWGELADLTVPMAYRGQLVGLIDVGESRGMRHFSDDDVRVLQAIADQAAIAIVNARTIKRLEEQAVTDDLTGLNNRRHLEERLRQEVAKARRYGQDLSALMMDLDDFKRFNDTFGHTLGDKLLQELAAILSCETRQEVDVVARYGGDEFVVVMPLTPSGDEDVGAAIAAAERIRAAVGAHLFEGYPGRRDQHITISIGVAGIAGAADPAAPVGMDAAGDDASTTAHAAAVLLTAADKALYLAKRQGRDRVCLYDG
ncbi:MAG: sensor domain-containing diguanylate cyclase [Thermoleophilia bacterium]